MHPLFALALVLLLGSCGRDATQVLVWVDVEPGSELEARAVALRVRVLDEDRAVVIDETRSLGGPMAELDLPASISLLPRGDDASRRFRVEARLLADGDVELARQVADGGFADGELREIWLVFADECAALPCGPGRTCIDGACRRACFEGRAPGQTTASTPAACPCDCPCDGDVCDEGFCRAATQLAALELGYAHACAIDDRSRLLCWGRNDRGQLGLGAADAEPHDRPVEIELAMAPTKIAAGAFHTCAVLADSSVWCWGANELGQLGTTGTDRAAPTQITHADGSGFGRVTSIGAGVGHTCVASEGGAMTCWGDNSRGQIGNGTVGPPLGPTAVIAIPSAPDVELHLGEVHSCAVQPSIGRLWCWGSDHDWQLGYEDQIDRYEPSPAPIDDGDPMTPERVIAATAGGWHTCALVNEGTLYCWGEVAEGRIGIVAPSDVRTPTRVFMDREFQGVALDAGRRHTCVIGEDTSLQCMGTRANGELGVGPDVSDTFLPLELQDDGWEDVALGESFTCGIRRGGGLYCWGLNAGGQLGVGGTDNALEPSRVCIP